MKQPDSRRHKFWISPIEGSEEFSIEAHEIEKTVFSVPLLDRQWLLSFNHLSDIALSHKAGPVDLILGVQYSHLHAECEIRQGCRQENQLNWDGLSSALTMPRSRILFAALKTFNLRKGQRTKQRNRTLVDLISKIWDSKN